jgi:hypothetical protein
MFKLTLEKKKFKGLCYVCFQRAKLKDRKYNFLTKNMIIIREKKIMPCPKLKAVYIALTFVFKWSKIVGDKHIDHLILTWRHHMNKSPITLRHHMNKNGTFFFKKKSVNAFYP